MSTPTELERVVEELFGKDPLRSRSFENKIRKALTAEREAGAREEREQAGKRYITLMNQAIGNTELPEEVWKKIAKVNQLILGVQ